jgi:hypothetical protein
MGRMSSHDKRSQDPGADAPRGSIPLVFGWTQYFGLAAAAFVGVIPVATWAMTLGLGFVGDTPASHGGAESEWEVYASIVPTFLLLVLPSILACLTLRARQPRGARVEWDDDAIVEWDGPWKRAVIPWRHAQVAHLSWVVRGKGTRWTEHALQIVDPAGASITLCSAVPGGAQVVRQRLHAPAADLERLVAAIASRGLEASGKPDWSLALDPDRPRRTWILVLGRLGYVFAVAAPIGAPDVTWPGYVLGAIATVLLGIRALPVLHELRATIARLREAPAPAPDVEATPFRTAPAVPTADTGRAAALRLKLRAVGFEALVRIAFVGLVIASTLVGAVVLHRR